METRKFVVLLAILQIQSVLARKSFILSENEQHGIGRNMLASAKVGGIGAGVVIIITFALLCLIICLAGARTKRPLLFYFGSTAVFLIVFTILVAAPKGEHTTPPEGYDSTVTPRIVIFCLLCFAACVGMGAGYQYVVLPKILAKPLSYQKDVLGMK